MLNKTGTETESFLFGTGLYSFAAYTVIIKYVMPVAWAVMTRAPLDAYIYFWDAWWIAHIAVGYGLRGRKPGTWLWAFLLAAVEVIIITTKLVLFWRVPVLDFWRVNWLVNKSLLLVFFAVLLAWLAKKEVRALIGRGSR